MVMNVELVLVLRCIIPVVFHAIRREWVHQNRAVFVSYLLGRRHVSVTVGHLHVTKIYEEKIYRIRTLVGVPILRFQRDLVVWRLSILKLIIYSSGEVDRE
jgi:hypothetical protein